MFVDNCQRKVFINFTQMSSKKNDFFSCDFLICIGFFNDVGLASFVLLTFFMFQEVKLVAKSNNFL